jgi:hypothetical protein
MSVGSWSFLLADTKLPCFYQKDEWAIRKLLYFVNIMGPAKIGHNFRK